jgi:dethiobiotin synthetase
VSRTLVVTGTDTEVGKTVVTAAIAAVAGAMGRRVAVVKPVQTGVAPGEPGDLEEVRRLSGAVDLHEFARLHEPLAPGTAASRSGVELPSIGKMTERILSLVGRELVLVEGAGGLLVELGSQGGTIADLAAGLQAPLVVVARAGLGTLNHAGLTCRAIRSRGLQCLGVVIGAWPGQPDLAARCNLDDLPRYTGTAVLGRLPEHAAQMGREAFLQAAQAGLADLMERL